MSTLASAVRSPASSTQARATPVWATLAIWLGASAIAVFFALVDSSVFDGHYLPRGNDSFYHAHRILDALGARGFYQFDDRIQAPEGAWISWPWGYDYLVAKSAQLAMWIHPSLDPMAFISYIPVAWLLVNAALFLACARAIGLSLEMRVLAMLCFALSPLTQLLHSVGQIDHHYVEHTFVLLNVWLGLRWFENGDDARRAAALAIALGVAQSFHNGLFILQLVPLAAVFILWLRGAAPSQRALWTFGGALVVATQLILIPSEPYRRGMFEFGLLSWFHFYVAVCTAAALAYMGWRRFSVSHFAQLAALCAVLALPLGAQVLGGAAFLTGKFSILDQIVEMRSPYRLFTSAFGPLQTASYYSWLLLIAPLLFVHYAFRVLRERAPERLYYAIAAAFGLAMFLDQLRLQYYGFFAFVTGGLLIVEALRARHGWHRGATFVGAFAVIVLAYQPALRERLFVVYAPAADPEYASTYTIFEDLHDMCATDPGVVLASSEDGSPIVFHSACSVIANNFILRPADKAHIDEIDRLMRLSPAAIRNARPDVKYVLVRARDFSIGEGEKTVLVESSPIARELFVADKPPPGFTLIKTVRRHEKDEGVAGIYARLYKVSPLEPAAGG